MNEQCRVAEDERAHDVEYIELNRPKTKFTGLEAVNLDHQKLLLKYATEELTDGQEMRIKYHLGVINKTNIGDAHHAMIIIHEAMANIARAYIVSYFTPLHEKHGEDWLFENYGVYEPEEV